MCAPSMHTHVIIYFHTLKFHSESQNILSYTHTCNHPYVWTPLGLCKFLSNVHKHVRTIYGNTCDTFAGILQWLCACLFIICPHALDSTCTLLEIYLHSVTFVGLTQHQKTFPYPYPSLLPLLLAYLSFPEYSVLLSHTCANIQGRPYLVIYFHQCSFVGYTQNGKRT